jgi:two-component system, LuxR family, response regulator FixJ
MVYEAMSRETTIYLVENDPAVRDSLKILLECHGIIVRDFASEIDFLRDYELRPRGCLVLDVHTPSVGGLDFVHTMSEMGIVIPTVLITEGADTTIRSRALEAGVVDVLEKPFDGTALVETIQRVTAR